MLPQKKSGSQMSSSEILTCLFSADKVNFVLLFNIIMQSCITFMLQKDGSDVIEESQVVDINTTNDMTSQEVYIIEDQALDLSVNTSKPQSQSKQDVALDLSVGTSGKRPKSNLKVNPKAITKKRRSGAKDMDHIVKFGNYGLAGAPQTKRQMSLLLKKKEEEEKAKKAGSDGDPSKQHSMEDIVHAEILISLKRSQNEEDEEDGEHMETDEDAEETQEKTDESTKTKPESSTDQKHDGNEKASEKKDETPENQTKEKLDCQREQKETYAITEPEKGEDEKKFKCEKCSKEFECEAAVAAHNAEHKHEYMCRMCHNIFNQKDTYVTHLGSHFPPIEVSSESGKQTVPVKTLKCDTCFQTGFPSQKALDSHKNEHYTVIPTRIGGDKDPMTLVVHPSSSIVAPAKIVDTETSPKTAGSKNTTTNAIETVKSVEAGNSESTTSMKEITKLVESENIDKTQGTDSVDGMSTSSGKDEGKKEKISDKKEEVNSEESQLPAFSEIVRDVDEFFIKDVKPEKKSDVVDGDTDKAETEISKNSADTKEDKGRTESDSDESVDYSDMDKKSKDEKDSKDSKRLCIICNKQLYDEEYFDHMMLHSVYELAVSKIPVEKMPHKEASENVTEGNSTKHGYHCKLCNHKCDTFDELKSHVSQHVGTKSDVAPKASGGESKKKAKRGRKRKTDSAASDGTQKLAKMDKSKSASILAAALKTGPKFNVTAALTGNKGQSSKLSATGDDKNHSGKNDTNQDSESGVSTVVNPAGAAPSISEQSSVKVTSTENDLETSVSTVTGSSSQVVTVLAPRLVQDFASKLLVQGMQTFLLNSNPSEVKGVISPTPTAVVQVRPPQSVRFVRPVGTTALPKTSPPNTSVPRLSTTSTSLGQLRFVTSDVKASSQQQVILLKHGMGIGTMPVQITATAPTSKESTQAATSVPEAQKTGLQFTSVPQSLETDTTQSTTSVHTSLQASSASRPSANITVPLTLFQNLSGLTMSVSPALSTTQTLNLGTGGSVQVPVATTLPVVKAVPLSSAQAKVNPAIQTNLLNMVLARMTQPVSGAQPGSPITISLGTTPATLGQTGPRVSSFIRSPLATATLGQTQAKSETVNLQQVPIFLCQLCKKQGTKAVMTNHVCAKQPATLTSVSTSTANVLGLNTVTLGSMLAQTKKLGEKSPETSLKMPAENIGVKDQASGKTTTSDSKTGPTEDSVKLNTDDKLAKEVKKKYFLNVYECSKCKFTTMKKKQAEEHMITNHNSQPHECKYHQLKQRVQSGVSAGKVGHSLKCIECGLLMNTMATSQPVGGIETQASQGVTLLASKNSSPQSDLDEHKQKQLTEEVSTNPKSQVETNVEVRKSVNIGKADQTDKIFKCPQCQYWLASEVEAKEHMEECHSVQLHDCFFMIQEDPKDSLGLGKGKKGSACKTCGLIKTHKSSGSEKIEGSKVSGKGKTKSTSETAATKRKNASQVHSRGSNVCKDCNLVFESLFKLRQHKVIRHGTLNKQRVRVQPVRQNRTTVRPKKVGDKKGNTETGSDDSAAGPIETDNQTDESQLTSTNTADKDDVCDIENC